MGSDDDLPGLIRAAALGNRAAFGELYGRYRRAVHGVLVARVQPDDAEDIVQDVFMHAFAHLKELREPAAFGPDVTAEAHAALAAIQELPTAYRETLVLRLVERRTTRGLSNQDHRRRRFLGRCARR